MYDDGLKGEVEAIHHKGLRRGFDLGWSYKGRFDREIIAQEIERLKKNKSSKATILALQKLLIKLKHHPSNKEDISKFW